MKIENRIYASENECVKIERTEINTYWITFGAYGPPYRGVIVNPVYCGPFEDLAEAEKVVRKLRPSVQFYDDNIEI